MRFIPLLWSLLLATGWGCEKKEQPCEQTIATVNIELSPLFTDSINQHWLRGNWPAIVTFKDSGGNELLFKSEKVALFSGTAHKTVSERVVTEPCRITTFKYNSNIYSESRTLDGYNLPLQIIVVRAHYVPYEIFIDSSNIDSLTEYLAIYINNIKFNVPVLGVPAEPGFEFYPAFSLRGKQYDSVYKGLNPHVPSSAVVPSEVYYTFKEGVVAFRYSDNKLWVRE
ncbi:MAG TPA: hypothetical protein VEC12_10085 [Bacteroidia bacterium]|nr:hypothetical protein [Bacteroidia bacterium]